MSQPANQCTNCTRMVRRSSLEAGHVEALRRQLHARSARSAARRGWQPHLLLSTLPHRQRQHRCNHIKEHHEAKSRYRKAVKDEQSSPLNAKEGAPHMLSRHCNGHRYLVQCWTSNTGIRLLRCRFIATAEQTQVRIIHWINLGVCRSRIDPSARAFVRV